MNQDLRNKLRVVVVVIRVDMIRSVFAELAQCSGVITLVNVDQVAGRPYFNTDQHEVDALLVIELQQTRTILLLLRPKIT